MTKYIEQEIFNLSKVLNSSNNQSTSNLLQNIAQSLATNFDNGKMLVLFGNGGSAAESIHIAAEFTGRCIRDHLPYPALALSESPSALTAITNDYSFDEIFSRQVHALHNSIGMAIGFSTSGKSINVLNGLNTAKQFGITTVLMTQSNVVNEEILNKYDYVLGAESISTPRIQEIHLFWGHLIAELIEHR